MTGHGGGMLLDAHQLSPEQEAHLLERRRVAEAWAIEFASRLGGRKAPAVRISADDTYYAPVGNKLVIAVSHLAGMEDEQLRLLVAHEMGHFARRWRSLMAWTLVARVKEEVAADRVAIELTKASAALWEETLRTASRLHGRDAEGDWDFHLRQRFVAKYAVVTPSM